MKSFPLILGTVIVVGGIIAAVLLGNTAPQSTNTRNSQNANAGSTSNPPIANVATGNTNGNTNSPEVDQVDPQPIALAQYVEYTPGALSAAQQSSGKTLLYFHADWCPICRALEPSIQQNLNQLPSGLTILKVDYDNETALKQQYGVTYQHTFVQVDDQGNKLKLWSGSTDARDIADNLI